MKLIKYLEAKYTDGTEFFGCKGSGVLPYCISTNKFLINLRSNYSNEPNTYGVWGGAIEKKNPTITDIKNNVLKELKEESEFAGEIKLIKSTVFTKDKFKFYNFIGIVKNEFIPKLDHESAGYKWVSLTEMKKLSNLHFGLKFLINSKLFKDQISEIKLKYKNKGKQV